MLSLAPKQGGGRNANRRNSSQSEPSSEAESAVDSPLSEPLNVDVSYLFIQNILLIVIDF